MARRVKVETPRTTAQQLGALIKSARHIMRKDKGLNGDLDRLPMLTWIMFLKFLDDAEHVRETEAKLEQKRFRPAIEPPYRWRDWAAKEDGVTGDALTAFINNDEAVRPDGTRGPGLFAYLRSLQGANGGDRRDVIATVFKGTINRMQSGYLLRDVLNRINTIHFTSSEEIHTLGHLYESLLREMRDAAGDSGEFYTPRPLIRFIVAATNPRLGETVLDPAAGTGGFLVEAFEHLKKQCEKAEDFARLQNGTLFGVEAKPMPYLLCQMNLLLHGLESPEIDPENALRFPLREIGDKDRVDVIMTNPPFGGEEERGILGNFPEDKQTTETALLFLQLIMRRLKRHPKPGRAGVVVPDGVLAGDGVCARIKEEMLKDFNLHTIVRLPSGVFSPYTGIPTNLLFFDRSGPTKEIWYYEHPLPEDRKNYTKTKPLQYEEFAVCLAWWKSREENEQAWRVPVERIFENGCNLDIKNPSILLEDYSTPIVERNLGLSTRINTLSGASRAFLQADAWRHLLTLNQPSWKRIRLDDVLRKKQEIETVRPEVVYRLLGVQLAGKGPFLREVKLGQDIGASRLNRVSSGDFIYSRLFAWRGAFGIVPPELDRCYVSNEFPNYAVDQTVLLPEYLRLYFLRPAVWREVEKKCQGTTKASRNRFKEEFLLNMTISIPDTETQRLVIGLAITAQSLTKEANSIEAALINLPLHLLAAIYRGGL